MHKDAPELPRALSRSGSSASGTPTHTVLTPDTEGVPPFPITPAQALKLFRHTLTDMEQSEILDYPAIYFLGQDLRSKLASNARCTLTNSGCILVASKCFK